MLRRCMADTLTEGGSFVTTSRMTVDRRAFATSALVGGLSVALGVTPRAEGAGVDPAAAEKGLTLSRDQQGDAEVISKGLEDFFTRYMPVKSGKFVVHDSAVIADGYGDALPKFEKMASELNAMADGRVAIAGDRTASASSAKSYAQCVVLSALGIPAGALSAGTWTAIADAIKMYRWGLAAKTIVRGLGPAALKGVLRAVGGPAAIAAALAGSAIVCAGS